MMLKFLCVHLLIFLTCIVDDLTNLLKEIMQEARNITNAEKCSVFLMESDVNELVAKVFDGDIASDEVSCTDGSSFTCITMYATADKSDSVNFFNRPLICITVLQHKLTHILI